MRALWLVALLLAPCAAAEADAETNNEVSVMDCIGTHSGYGGSAPRARLEGDPQYIYVPGSPFVLMEEGDSRAGPIGYGTYITWGSGCLDMDGAGLTVIAAGQPLVGIDL